MDGKQTLAAPARVAGSGRWLNGLL